MKITKQGTDPDARIMKGRCTKCGCEAEATRHEMKSMHFDQRENQEYGNAFCPCCHDVMYFYYQ